MPRVSGKVVDWFSVASAGLKGGALGGATVLAVYLLRLLFWDGPVPEVIRRFRWVIGFMVAVAVFIALDVLGVGSGVQRTVSAAVVLGVAFALKDRRTAEPASRDDPVISAPPPEGTMRDAPAPQGRRSRSIYYYVIPLLAAVIGGVVAKEAIRWWQTPAPVPPEILSETWSHRRLGGSSLSIALPGPLDEQEAAVPTEVAAVTQTWRQYRYTRKGVEVHGTHTVYVEEVIADLEGAIAGAMGSMSRVRGVSGFRHHREPFRVGNKVGALVRFGFAGGRQPYVGQALFFVRGNESWSVILLYSASDAAATRFADRVIRSARFDGE